MGSIIIVLTDTEHRTLLYKFNIIILVELADTGKP